MSRKSLVTQKLANGFPQWSRIRQDEQSVGQGFLNVIGRNMEPLTTELQRGYKNLFLSTANVGEIDLTYVFDLPPSFNFRTQIDGDPTSAPISPTVTGLVGSTWYPIKEVESGTLADFWYKAIPTRVSTISSFSGSASLLAEISGDTLVSNTFISLPLDNYITIEIEGNNLYRVENNTVYRSKVKISGETWKGTKEDEEILFLFSQRKRTNKIWKSISKIELIDCPEDVSVKLYSHEFGLSDYPDIYNDKHQFPDSRDDMSVFWSVSDSLLQRKKYAVSSPVDLLRNQTDIVTERTWELLDSDDNPVLAKDIALLPYNHRAWVIDDSKLYLYDLNWDQPNISRLTERTSSPLCRIETSSDYTVRNEEVVVDLMFMRPIKTLVRHRFKIQYPDGQELGIMEDGTLVPVTFDYWIQESTTERFIRPTTTFEFTDLGEHLLTLECQYLDGTVEVDQRLILVDSKKPLAVFNLDFTPEAIDIDHLNRLLILDSNGDIQYLNLHYDVVLIDYENKELIFRENYDEVKVVR